MFGIHNKILNDKFVLFLIDQGCMPAYYYYRASISRSGDRFWTVKVSKLKNKIEKKFNFLINDDPHYALVQKSKIIKIHQKALDLPMRALIYPFNGDKLNQKLYQFSTRDRLRDFRREIANGSLRKRETKFTTADHNNIRRSIVWLNWFMFDENIMNKSTRVENVDLCLSQDAVAVFAIEGFDGLYRISKKNKKRLKACFNKFPDNKQACMSFLSLASVELNSLINYRMSKLRLDNLFRCYQYFIDSHSKPTDKRRMPNYYMYNPNILKTQKNLELLFKFGYMRMQHMKFFDSKNAEIVRDKDIYTLLHDSYSTFKS